MIEIYKMIDYNADENYIYLIMLSAHIRIAFGLQSIRPEYYIDVILMNAWMFLAVSL